MDHAKSKGALANPLTDWPNDDLLLNPSIRDYLYQHFPRTAPFFDGSDLGELFAAHDAPANAKKRASRRWGLIAVLLGSLSLALAACAPLTIQMFGSALPWSLTASSAVLGLMISALAVAGAVIGYTQALSGKSKREWLTHRLWTERIRQLHFQVMVNNLDVISRAIESGDLAPWNRLRKREIDHFCHYHMASTDELLEVLWSDKAEEKTWVNTDWQHSSSGEILEDRLGEFFSVYVRQRFGIQSRYSRLRLSGGMASARTQSRFISSSTTTLTVLAVLDSVALAAMHVFGLGFDELAVQAGTAVLGLLGSGVMGLHALEDGLKPNAETDRLEWYLAAVSGLQDRFEAADTIDHKVDVMRDMERLVYQEMRRFFIAAQRSRFVL